MMVEPRLKSLGAPREGREGASRGFNFVACRFVIMHALPSGSAV